MRLGICGSQVDRVALANPSSEASEGLSLNPLEALLSMNHSSYSPSSDQGVATSRN